MDCYIVRFNQTALIVPNWLSETPKLPPQPLKHQAGGHSALHIIEVCHFLTGSGNSQYLENLQKKRAQPNPQVLQAKQFLQSCAVAKTNAQQTEGALGLPS